MYVVTKGLTVHKHRMRAQCTATHMSWAPSQQAICTECVHYKHANKKTTHPYCHTGARAKTNGDNPQPKVLAWQGGEGNKLIGINIL